MRRLSFAALLCLYYSLSGAQTIEHVISSPDKKIVVNCSVEKATYTISYQGKTILQNSRLGIVREDEDFSKDLRLTKALPIVPVKDSYTILTAKRSSVTYLAGKMVLQTTNSSGDKMNIIF